MGIILPSDELICFNMVIAPPTSNKSWDQKHQRSIRHFCSVSENRVPQHLAVDQQIYTVYSIHHTPLKFCQQIPMVDPPWMRAFDHLKLPAQTNGYDMTYAYIISEYLSKFYISSNNTGWWFGTWLLFFPFSWECHHPNWLSLHHFSRWLLHHQPATNREISRNTKSKFQWRGHHPKIRKVRLYIYSLVMTNIAVENHHF